jgi:MYXO-CTERM domain-containing protein
VGVEVSVVAGRWRWTVCGCVLAACGGATDVDVRAGSLAAGRTPTGNLGVLVFSRTQGFRHGSIDDAVPAIEAMGLNEGWTVDATEDPSVFDPATLAMYRVVVFALTTGDVLDGDQEAAFEAFMAAGGGYVGIHSASDTEYDWTFYGDMLGAYFDGHPSPQDATITVVDDAHPSTTHLGQTWERFDEWYNFAPNPAGDVHVLLNLEESSYDGGTMGDQHPIAWTRETTGGRVFYTGGGHTSESYADPDFLTHLRGGIAWAAGDPNEGGSTSGTGDPGSTSDGGDPTSSTSAASTSSAGTTTTTSTTGAGGDTGSSGTPATDGGGAEAEAGDGGCACRTRGPSSTPLSVILVGFAVVRRRRRTIDRG